MKLGKWMIAIVVLIGLSTLTGDAQLQRTGNESPRRIGSPGAQSQIGETICDVLVLDTQQSTKVETACLKAQESMQTKIREALQNRADQSPGQRGEKLKKILAENNIAVKESLKGILKPEELKSVEPFVDNQRLPMIPELRVLRTMELKSEQRAKLQPEALTFAKGMLDLRLKGKNILPVPDSQQNTANLQKQFAVKATEILTKEQVQIWNTKTAELKKDVEIQRQKFMQIKPQGVAPGAAAPGANPGAVPKAGKP